MSPFTIPFLECIFDRIWLKIQIMYISNNMYPTVLTCFFQNLSTLTKLKQLNLAENKIEKIGMYCTRYGDLITVGSFRLTYLLICSNRIHA